MLADGRGGSLANGKWCLSWSLASRNERPMLYKRLSAPPTSSGLPRPVRCARPSGSGRLCLSVRPPPAVGGTAIRWGWRAPMDGRRRITTVEAAS